MIDLEQLPRLPIERTKDLPAISCIYFVADKTNLFYVGRAKNLRTRWVNHHRGAQLTEQGGCNIYWLACSESNLAKEERKYIDLLSPIKKWANRESVHSFQ